MDSQCRFNIVVGRSSGLGLVLLMGAVLLAAPLAMAEEGGHGGGEAESHEHSYHKHVVSLFGGAATHTQHNDTGGAVGLSYAYQLNHKWAVGVKGEYASSSLERDYILLLGVAYELVGPLEVAAAVGGEKVEKEEEHHGEVIVEKEDEFLLRLTAGYVFHLGGRFGLTPEFNVDFAGGHVTLVYGLVFSVGL